MDASFREIEQALPECLVLQHARPTWLAGQHLDVYVPDAHVAIEYQGRQHFEPVEFFGGEEAFQRTQKRDRRKARLCKRNGVPLFAVEEGYSLDQLLGAIRERMSDADTDAIGDIKIPNGDVIDRGEF